MPKKRARRAETDPKRVGGEKDSIDDENKSSPPLRDTSHLFASPITISCALECVPCAYKIGLFDVALDREFCKLVPNQRPEQCPRSSAPPPFDPIGFQAGMSVLTVGDGDFSFSLALARLLKPRSNNTKLVATSYETKETLRKVYPNFDLTISELDLLGATVCYKVNATDLKRTLPASFASHKFHRICWNFPCTAISKGQDGQNDAMERNKGLVREFVLNARYSLSPVDGEIHMCHKTKPPFNQWKLEIVALDNIKGDRGPDLHFAGRVVLDRFLFPPYIPRKALDRKSFPCHDACFYVFRQEEKTHIEGTKKFAPTIDSKCRDSVDVVTTDAIVAVRRSHLKMVASEKQNRSTKKRKR